MRLIDADALTERHCEGCKEDVREICKTDPVCASLMWVFEEPTVDAVAVVRCRDCKYWHKDTDWCDHHSHFITSEGAACHPWESVNWKMFDENDFCSYGERKADDGK